MNTLERTLIEKAGSEHGWENVLESTEAGVVLGSARHRARAVIQKRVGGIGWRLDLPGRLMHQELTRDFPAQALADGSFAADDVALLARLLRRAAELAQSLPRQAAETYRERVEKVLASIPAGGTEVARIVKQRAGQDTFREALMDYWGGACAVTGIAVPEVLRASHAKPWADCANDDERLDVFNGFLLVANLDALFDRRLITFDASGALIASPRLDVGQRNALQLTAGMTLRWLAPEHQAYLGWHREKVYLATTRTSDRETGK
jgi:hypothetical protein